MGAFSRMLTAYCTRPLIKLDPHSHAIHRRADRLAIVEFLYNYTHYQYCIMTDSRCTRPSFLYTKAVCGELESFRAAVSS